MTELIEAKILRVNSQREKINEQSIKELQEKVNMKGIKYLEHCKKEKEKKDIKKKHEDIVKHIRMNTLKRQRKKDQYKRQILLDYIKDQEEKINNMNQVRNIINTQR